MIKLPLILTCIFLLSFTGCKMQEKEKSKKRKITTEDLISANRYMVGQDAAAIKGYVERNNLNLQETQTGLWYKINTDGLGSKAKTGNIIVLNYDITLLDGTPIYNSTNNGIKEFTVGHGGVESGLEEGVLMLQKGDKATFIMPPHLAHGLVGDDNLIPPRATIIYNVEVLDIKE